MGLGAIVAEAARVTEEMFLVAARALAEQVAEERLAPGALYPPIESLADISREVALAVATRGRRLQAWPGRARDRPRAVVDEAMWWPSYVPYIRSRAAVHRDEIYAAHQALTGR